MSGHTPDDRIVAFLRARQARTRLRNAAPELRALLESYPDVCASEHTSAKEYDAMMAWRAAVGALLARIDEEVTA